MHLYYHSLKNRCIVFSWASNPAKQSKNLSEDDHFWHELNQVTYTPEVAKCVIAHLDVLKTFAKTNENIKKWPNLLKSELNKQIGDTKQDVKNQLSALCDQILLEVPDRIRCKIDENE